MSNATILDPVRPTHGQLGTASSDAFNLMLNCERAIAARGTPREDWYMSAALANLEQAAKHLGYELVPARKLESA